MVDTSFWHQLAARFRSRWDFNAEWNASGPDSRGHWRFIGVNTDIEAFKLSARLGAVALGAPDTADAFLAWLDRLVSDSSDFAEPPKSPQDMVCFIGELSALFCEQLATESQIQKIAKARQHSPGHTAASNRVVTPASPTSHELLSVAEVAREMGVSQDTIRRHIGKGALAVIHLGPTKRVRVSREVLEAYKKT